MIRKRETHAERTDFTRRAPLPCLQDAARTRSETAQRPGGGDSAEPGRRGGGALSEAEHAWGQRECEEGLRGVRGQASAGSGGAGRGGAKHFLTVITSEADYSQNIKTGLLLARKVMIKPESVQKKRHYFASKGPYTQSYSFSSSQVGIRELVHKEGSA